jgi:hypothetical protein
MERTWQAWQHIVGWLDWHDIARLSASCRALRQLADAPSRAPLPLCCQLGRSSARCTLLACRVGLAAGERQRLLQRLINAAARRQRVLVFGKRPLEARANVLYLGARAFADFRFAAFSTRAYTIVINFSAPLKAHLRALCRDAPALGISLIFSKRLDEALWPHFDRLLLTRAELGVFANRASNNSLTPRLAQLQAQESALPLALALDASVPAPLALAALTCEPKAEDRASAATDAALLMLMFEALLHGI